MSLFGKLIRLRSDERCPLEDFHTEIVACVLANDLVLTLDWLRELGITKTQKADNITLTTQVSLGAIEGVHDVGSRPDIVISLSGERKHEIVFIESKVGSKAGEGQLKRYLDHLAIQSGFSRKTLLFITRDYEPKEDMSNDDVKFVQTRWFEFYRFIHTRDCKSTIIKELGRVLKLYTDRKWCSWENGITSKLSVGGAQAGPGYKSHRFLNTRRGSRSPQVQVVR